MAEFQEDQNTVYYREYYQYAGQRKWMEQVWSSAFGDEYPAGLNHYGYLTRHDLGVFEAEIACEAGASLLDIGCGRGGPGLYIAQQKYLKLTGIDVISEAIAQARAFQASFELAYPARFEVGQFFAIPLPDHSMDAVICIDSLWAAVDKIQALREIKRVMKLGARVVFTYWDLHAIDSAPLFEHSGLRFISRHECPDWKEYQRKVYEGILAHENDLIAEMGPGANMLLYEAKASSAYLNMSVRRIYVMEA